MIIWRDEWIVGVVRHVLDRRRYRLRLVGSLTFHAAPVAAAAAASTPSPTPSVTVAVISFDPGVGRVG